MVDLNADMGEGFGPYRLGSDAELLDYVTSANIACGFHAGDPRTMDVTVAAAVERGVTIGAHVSYPDLVGFGRRHMVVSHDELVTDVIYQIGALDAFCRRHGTQVQYVKAHGALYNDCSDDPELAEAFADSLVAYDRDLAVLALSGSTAADVFRRRGLRVFREGFADRAYTPEGRLQPRTQPGAVLHDADLVTRRGRQLAAGEMIEDISGGQLHLDVDSICVHGDTPSAVESVRSLRAALDAHAHVTPFVRPDVAAQPA